MSEATTRRTRRPGKAGRRVGYVPMMALHRGFIEASAQALLDGVPAGRISDAPFREAGRLTSAPAPSTRERELATQIEELTTRVEASYLAAARAIVGSAAERTAQRDGVQLKRELSALQEELLSLSSSDTSPANQTGMRVETALLADALAGLMSEDGRVSSEQARALDWLVTDFEMTAAGSSWDAQAYLRVPLVDGVGRLGPIRWSVEMPARRGASLVLERLDGDGKRGRVPLRTVDDLVAIGLTRKAAMVATDCPFHWLVPVIRHVLADEPLPREIPKQWSQPAFMEWIARVYADPDFNWDKAYSWYHFKGQRLIYEVTAAGGVASGRQLCEKIERMTNPRLTAGMRELFRTWNGDKISTPSVRYTKQSRKGDRGRGGRYDLYTCPCGASARLMISAPEVPRRLLCERGHMLDGQAFGMPAGVVFPDEYRALAPTAQQCVDHADRDRGAGAKIRVGHTAMEILKLRELQAPRTMTSAEIATAVDVGVESARDTLRRMEANGLITKRAPDKRRAKGAGRLPDLWSVEGDPLEGKDVIVVNAWTQHSRKQDT